MSKLVSLADERTELSSRLNDAAKARTILSEERTKLAREEAEHIRKILNLRNGVPPRLIFAPPCQRNEHSWREKRRAISAEARNWPNVVPIYQKDEASWPICARNWQTAAPNWPGNGLRYQRQEPSLPASAMSLQRAGLSYRAIALYWQEAVLNLP